MIRVRVPRAVYSKYHQMPWLQMYAAAECGDDGLRIIDAQDASDPKGTADFRQGTGEGNRGTAFLYEQHW